MYTFLAAFYQYGIYNIHNGGNEQGKGARHCQSKGRFSFAITGIGMFGKAIDARSLREHPSRSICVTCGDVICGTERVDSLHEIAWNRQIAFTSSIMSNGLEKKERRHQLELTST